MEMDQETAFLSGLIELQYGQANHDQLKKIADQFPAYQGWPENPKSFWNAEAFMWSHKINKEIRAIIKTELQKLSENNLDLGCGAYSYIPSTGFDLSEKMLNNNENCHKKIIGNLEKELPFLAQSFQSITAIFVLNYINNYHQLLTEIHRILINQGTFVMILSTNNLNQLHQRQQKNKFTCRQWQELLQKHFQVTLKQKSNLLFFTCTKQKT
jgi:ubiquinone/menaquinone biosynthesis C-methylase UbiE